jgi:Uma2 family endonuclease
MMVTEHDDAQGMTQMPGHRVFATRLGFPEVWWIERLNGHIFLSQRSPSTKALLDNQLNQQQ